jgi:predicted MFS family arabinose efflux permease
MPVKEKLSYGAQISVLKKPITWISIVAVILMNGAVFGVFSYLVEYLDLVANFSWNAISLVLLVYGLANILGSIIAGRLLTRNAMKSVVAFPFALGAIYVILFLTGQFTIPMVLTTLAWGILGGIGANINQYWLATVAPEAPDFANGLFLTSANLGTTLGATVCGFVIAELGIKFVVIGGLVFSLLSVIFIFGRVKIGVFDKARLVLTDADEKELSLSGKT